jgi:hypothetical protein
MMKMHRDGLIGLMVLLISLTLACNLQTILSETKLGTRDQKQSEDPFVGGWIAEDPVDGSSMILTIEQEDSAYQILLLDKGATICGLDEAGNPVFAAELKSVGIVQGEILRTSAPSLKCLSDPPTFQNLDLTIDYSYQSATDTLIDSVQDARWERR